MNKLCGLLLSIFFIYSFQGNYASDENVMPTLLEFKNAVTNNGFPEPSEDQYNNFVKHGERWGRITSKQETAMALAQLIFESDGLRAKREYACLETNCTNAYRQPDCDHENQYYYGRGYIQLSWCRWNYKPASFDIFGDDRLVRDPDLVARDDDIAWATSFWFWGTRVHDKPGVTEGKFGVTTRVINGIECGGSGKIAAKRFKIYNQVLKAFNFKGYGNPEGCYTK